MQDLIDRDRAEKATYEVKVEHYQSQNLLAASLNSKSYVKHPGFLKFIEATGVPFEPYEHFKASNINERGSLYRAIAKQIWNPDDIDAVAKAGT